MALSLLPHQGHLLKIFLVLVVFLLAPATPAAVQPHLRVIPVGESGASQRTSLSPLDLPSQHHERDGSCPISGDHWCGSNLPGDFCCSSDSFCKILAANTTALCCPNGTKGSCQVILPITCDIKSLSPSRNPQAEIKSLVLNRELKRCGSKSGTQRCCPFGYSCRDDKECVLDKDQDESYAFLLPVSEYTSRASPVTTPTDTPSLATSDLLSVETSQVPDIVLQPPPVATTAATTEPSTSDDGDGEKSGGISPTGAVTAGTVAGVCCLAGIGVFLWMKWLRKKKSRDTPHMPLVRESWGYFSAGGTPSTRHVRLTRGPDDKFIITPTTAGFSPTGPYPLSPAAGGEEQSPVELPATPVSLCMWMNFENAAVEEPKLAFVVPAKQQT
ncbi:hypothetical protein F66182_8336 [Fusarium sp. NRRL 66182]|nr:hypothetical protein F66182_8336 [Fusarium sp. NRRL 66182]